MAAQGSMTSTARLRQAQTRDRALTTMAWDETRVIKSSVSDTHLTGIPSHRNPAALKWGRSTPKTLPGNDYRSPGNKFRASKGANSSPYKPGPSSATLGGTGSYRRFVAPEIMMQALSNAEASSYVEKQNMIAQHQAALEESEQLHHEKLQEELKNLKEHCSVQRASAIKRERDQCSKEFQNQLREQDKEAKRKEMGAVKQAMISLGDKHKHEVRELSAEWERRRDQEHRQAIHTARKQWNETNVQEAAAARKVWLVDMSTQHLEEMKKAEVHWAEVKKTQHKTKQQIIKLFIDFMFVCIHEYCVILPYLTVSTRSRPTHSNKQQRRQHRSSLTN